MLSIYLKHLRTSTFVRKRRSRGLDRNVAALFLDNTFLKGTLFQQPTVRPTSRHIWTERQQKPLGIKTATATMAPPDQHGDRLRDDNDDGGFEVTINYAISLFFLSSFRHRSVKLSHSVTRCADLGSIHWAAEVEQKWWAYLQTHRVGSWQIPHINIDLSLRMGHSFIHDGTTWKDKCSGFSPLEFSAFHSKWFYSNALFTLIFWKI